MFWSLGSFGDFPKEAGESWQMQSRVLWDLESYREDMTPRNPLVVRKSLEGSSTLGRLNLEGLLLFVYSNFIL